MRNLFLLILVSVISLTGFAQKSVPKQEIVHFIEEWNTANNTQNLNWFQTHFKNRLTFYGRQRSKKAAIASKRSFFKRHPNYRQELGGELIIVQHPNEIYTIRFNKTSFTSDDTTSYTAYLVIHKYESTWGVVEEGDFSTDKRLNRISDFGKELNSLTVPLAEKSGTTHKVWWWVLSGLGVFLLISVVALSKSRKKEKVTATNVEERDDHETMTNSQTTVKEGVNEAKLKGDIFEEYTVKKFPKGFYEVREWRGDKTTNSGVFAVSNQYPDLEILFKRQNIRFAVECKYRSNAINGGIEICSADQWERYKQFENENGMPVYLFIGLGGQPERPERHFLLLLEEMSHYWMSLKELQAFESKEGSNEFYYDLKISRLTFYKNTNKVKAKY